MATKSLFQKLEASAAAHSIPLRTRQSRDWFRKEAGKLTNVSRRKLIKETEVKGDVTNNVKKMGINEHGPGRMYMYFYDPKTKKTLPFYDKFPLTIMVDRAPGGFYGLNLHYLSPIYRAKLLDALMETVNNKTIHHSAKFKINYRILTAASKFKYYQPCFKHYLTTHLKSQMALVEYDHWEIATFLPTAMFEKATAEEVYKDSRSKF